MPLSIGKVRYCISADRAEEPVPDHNGSGLRLFRAQCARLSRWISERIGWQVKLNALHGPIRSGMKNWPGRTERSDEWPALGEKFQEFDICLALIVLVGDNQGLSNNIQPFPDLLLSDDQWWGAEDPIPLHECAHP